MKYILNHLVCINKIMALDGFEWLVVDDSNQSVFAIERKDTEGNSIIAVMNFSRKYNMIGYKIPVNINQVVIKRF